MHNDTAPLLSSKQACEQLGGIDRSTLIRWVERGLITPAHKLPGATGAYLFSAEAVAARRAAIETTA